MNLPPPLAKFERHNSLFLNVLKTISEDSMNAAVHEAVIANDNNSNIAVAVDGTWHKRGYSSLNGVVCATSVENGKVVEDFLSKFCQPILNSPEKLQTAKIFRRSLQNVSVVHWSIAIDVMPNPALQEAWLGTVLEVTNVQQFVGSL
ncbi:uncharacterized protein TNCV_4400291 [Trichonephila clavipes]|nr:uncharacterized protein TNCV_4400291 [Trichonephila clavipes]